MSSNSRLSLNQIISTDHGQNCSAYASFMYLMSYGIQSSDEQIPYDSALGYSSTFYYVNSDWLWFFLVVSVIFLWSGSNLWSGIWNCQRRRLVPWLLVTGVTILFFIMSSFWLLICNKSWYKLLCLVPAALALLFLFWWLLINDLLEEIHEEKKAEVNSSNVHAGITEGFAVTTTAVAAAVAATGNKSEDKKSMEVQTVTNNKRDLSMV